MPITYPVIISFQQRVQNDKSQLSLYHSHEEFQRFFERNSISKTDTSVQVIINFVTKYSKNESSIPYNLLNRFCFRTRFVTDAYVDATKTPYSYLLFDLRQETSENIRIRTDIFSNPIKYISHANEPVQIYITKKIFMYEMYFREEQCVTTNFLAIYFMKIS